MKKKAAKTRPLNRQEKALAAIIVPPSPYDFEETVRRVLKVKPPAKKRTP